MGNLSVEEIKSWLEEVKDPEIPVLSLVDLGVITDVKTENEAVYIEMTPTFVGCPAMDMMKQDVIEVLNRKGISKVNVNISFKEPWTSDKISTKGRLALKKFGLAPPPSGNLFTDIDILEYAQCPRCNGTNTELKNPFGPTLCRSIHYCNNCQEAFEQFKPL
ncbi:MAG: phenylacetate-CoA oxygenase subunit PaaJ [Cyclobacteriaceae bacterium]|nr:phenylacetate-CoA oxygenase subunit PaaJ [Cyclobacteriaceae bacterium]UYN87828.1 MAG: phenylacetate-CoA oxygenase subunit PaaJ [Cyclobacteriaceae bacterium]